MSDAPAPTSAAALGDPLLRDRDIDAGGARLHVVESLTESRDGDERLVLFLHGFPEFWYAWRRQLRFVAQAFGARWRAAAPDMRGYNLSDKPAGLAPYRLDRLAGDALGTMRALGHERMVLVGHDWGGVVAWATAAAHPEAVERLVILNAPHPAVFARLLRGHAPQIEASRYMTDFLDPGTEERLLADDASELARWITTWAISKGLMTGEDDRRYRAAWRVPGALTAMLAYYRARSLGAPPPADPAALRVRAPTRVLWGMKDRALTPANLDGLAEYAPDLTVERVEDAGHWIVHERPDRVEAALRWALAAGQGRSAAPARGRKSPLKERRRFLTYRRDFPPTGGSRRNGGA